MRKNTLIIFAALLVCASGAAAQEFKEPSVTWDNLRAHPAPLPVIGEIQPVKSDPGKTSVWSIGAETMDRDYADFNSFRPYIAQTGAGYTRLQSGWAKTEQKKGRYDFSWLDAHVDGMIAEGLRPWICLCYGNPLYSKSGMDLDAKLFPDGPVMDAWLRYVKKCVARYKDKVTMWEVWNEPDGRSNLDSYALYANLFVRTAQAIREVAPEAKIAGFGSCSPDREYIRQAMKIIKERDGVKYMDYLTYHAYWPVPEKIVPYVRQLQEDLKDLAPGVKLLMGEAGCPGQLEYGHAMHTLEWNEYSQAKWDLRQALTHWGLGIPYSFFTMADLNYGWMLQSFGLIRMNGKKEAVYKRPKFYAVQHVTSLFDGSLQPLEGISVACPLNREITSIGISRDKVPVGCLLWLSGARPTDTLERIVVDVRLGGLEMKEPVYVDLLTGYIHDLSSLVEKFSYTARQGGSTGIIGLPLWDSPVMIIEKSTLQK